MEGDPSSTIHAGGYGSRLKAGTTWRETPSQLLLTGRRLVGVVAAVGAAGNGAEHAMMAGIMTGDSAHHRALQATLGVGCIRGQRQGRDGEQYGDRSHGSRSSSMPGQVTRSVNRGAAIQFHRRFARRSLRQTGGPFKAVAVG